MIWYYAKNDQQFGPVEEAELRRLIAAGQVQRGDLVWMPELPDWCRAGEVPALFPKPVPPPVPTAALRVDPPAPRTPSVEPASAAGYATMAAAPYSAPEPYQPYQPPKADLSTYQPPAAYGAAPDGAPAGTGYASFAMRFAALLLDTAVVTIASMFVGLVLGVILAIGGGMGREGLSSGATGLINLFSIIGSWLYYALSEASAKRGTLGKRALGLMVTDLAGNQIDFGRASKRYFGKILSGLALGLGYLAVLWSPRKQGWHDQMADCLVLRTR